MRFYLSIQPARYPIPSRAGEIIASNLALNLRKFRIDSAFDYSSFTIQGVPVFHDSAADLEELLVRAAVGAPLFEPRLLRVILGDNAVPVVAARDDLELLLGVRGSTEYSWNGGDAKQHAWIGYPEDNIKAREAAVTDVFQDIMIAKCPSIQSIVAKYIATQPTNSRHIDTFYRAKVAYALRQFSPSRSLFTTFAPDRYVSFSSMIRTQFRSYLLDTELAALKDMWLGFMNTLSDHFLTPDEACHLVANGRFRDTLNFERKRRRYIPSGDLSILLNDKSLIRRTGSYILCIRVKKPKPGDLDEAVARFGYSSPDKLRYLRLCDDHSYHEMKRLVRSGVATPIRLFLRKP